MKYEKNSGPDKIVGSSDVLYVGLPPMPAGAFEATLKWLNNREVDIALDIEDFGDLRELFKVLIGREPKC